MVMPEGGSIARQIVLICGYVGATVGDGGIDGERIRSIGIDEGSVVLGYR